MLEDIEKSVKATLYDRLTSPLIGSYIFAWCIYNYKVFLVIFSELKYAEKINELNNLFVGWQFLFSFIMPFVWSLFYIFIYPYIAKFVFKKWQKYIKDKEDIKHHIREMQCLTVEQSQQLKLELAEKTLEFERLTSAKTETIKNLSEQNKNLQEKADGLTTRLQLLESQQTAVKQRDELIKKYGLSWEPSGAMLVQKSGTNYSGCHICTKCFNENPPKMAVLDIQKHCNTCGNQYESAGLNKIHVRTSPGFGCWDSSGEKVCPQCTVKYNNVMYAKLLKISEEEYYCPLCEKHFQRITS